MDSDTLRYFQQIADGLTVTEAAEIYQLSQPGVSRSLKRLEEEVGTPLLERSGRLLRTTHAGRVFKGYLDSCLHALDDGLAAVEELLDPETGVVRVAFQPSLGAWLVPSVIASFRVAHPQIRFDLNSSTDTQGSALVADGHADLHFTARRPRNPDVRWQQLIRQPLCLAVSPDHPLAQRASVALSEVSDDDFVMLAPIWELRTLVDELCRAAGFSPRVVFEENDTQVVRGFVAAGLGVAVVPAAPHDSPSASPGADRLVRLSDTAAFREVGVTWAGTRQLLPSAELFRRHAIATAAIVAARIG